jgi:hypothetical protein
MGFNRVFKGLICEVYHIEKAVATEKWSELRNFSSAVLTLAVFNILLTVHHGDVIT